MRSKSEKPINLWFQNDPMSFSKPFVIGISGGSASGKSRFLHSLMDFFTKDEVCLISQDNYYKENKFIPKDQNGIPNYDLPECIDYQLFDHHISSLKQGNTVEHVEYTFNQDGRVPKRICLKPAPILVVEGLFVFFDKTLSQNLDLKVFIDAKEKIKIARRIKRDSQERGIELEMVMYQWKNHVKPTYKSFIKPTKKKADLVINNNENFDNGLLVLRTFIEKNVNDAKRRTN